MKRMKYITPKQKIKFRPVPEIVSGNEIKTDEIGKKHKDRKSLLWGILAVVMAATLTSGIYMKHRTMDPLQPQIAEKILRFHILANSDSEEDQNVKKKVRDAIGQMMEPKLAAAKSLSDTEQIVEENMDAIVETAEHTLEKNGFSYGAGARLAQVDFPVKTYGDYTFPAGRYEALQVTLGRGEGHNWWCVLYPNMCFQGSVYEVVGDKADRKLRQVLSPEEYEDVFDSGNFKIRLKFLEYFQ